MGGRVLEPVDNGDDLLLLPGAETGVIEGEEELEALRDGNVESRLQLLVGFFISCDVPAGSYGKLWTEMGVGGSGTYKAKASMPASLAATMSTVQSLGV
jgi:hypothetical protein